MKARPADRDKVRELVRKQRGEDLLVFLDRAIDLLPPTKLTKLVEDYADPEQLSPDASSASGLCGAVKRFEVASLRGDYYQPFAVDSTNFNSKSRGTQVWIAECRRLLDLCVRTAGRGETVEALVGFDTIFDLLREVDEQRRDIVFFQDEAGSWQVQADWETVLPAWFRCLAKTAGPEEYAASVREAIDRFARYAAGRLNGAARRIATKEQRAALAKTES